MYDEDNFFMQCNFIYNSDTYSINGSNVKLAFTFTINVLIVLLRLSLLIQVLLYNAVGILKTT